MPEDNEQQTDQAAPPREERTYEQVVNRYLTRARKSLNLRERPEDEQASYYLSAAQTYAILELADAIRESRPV